MKCDVADFVKAKDEGRSREGAWIEISVILLKNMWDYGRSREGAWIEIVTVALAVGLLDVAPARERGLKYP